MPNITGTYEFSDTIQRKIIYLYWKDYQFHNVYQNVIQPRYFDNSIHMDLISLIDDYYKKYDNTPTLSTMLQQVSDLCNRSRSKANKLDDYKEEVRHISKLRSAIIKDKDYIADKVLDFGKRQAMTEAILSSVDIINKKSTGDLEDVEKLVRDALKVGDDVNDLGLFYFKDQKAIKERIRDSNRQITTVPTGIEAMDNLLQGGVARGELCVILAPPNRGKTMALINMGAGAIRAGYNVAHFSFEMDRKKVAARYDCNFLNKDHESILLHADKSSQDIFSLFGHGVSREQFEQEDEHKDEEQIKWGQLVIKDYPSGSCSINMIESYLRQLRSACGFKPDVVIIDYPDLMKPDKKRKEKRDELNDIYVSCRALGAKENFDCAVLAASQAHRDAFKKKTVKADDISDDFSKVMTADEIFTFS